MTILQMVTTILLLILFFLAKQIFFGKKKIVPLYYIIFFLIVGTILFFNFNPNFLNTIGHFIGIDRGVFALVYISIIVVFILILKIFNKIDENKRKIVNLGRGIAIEKIDGKVEDVIQNIGPTRSIKDNFIFLVRAYNEGEHLLQTIENIKKGGFKRIIVIDDGSTDSTFKNLKNRNDIFYIRHLTNFGPGAALETGLEFIRKYADQLNISYIVTFDADGQHRIEDMDRFIEEINKDQNYDIYIGSRFIQNTAHNIPLHRKIILTLGKIFTKIVSNINISDPHNGYRVINVNSLDKIQIENPDFSYASELIDIIYEKNLRFKEVPVNIYYSKYSLSKGQKSSNAINIASKMIYKKIFK